MYFLNYENTHIHVYILYIYVTQGLKNRRLLLPSYWARDPNKRKGFSSLQFFNSPGVREFAITCKVVTRF